MKKENNSKKITIAISVFAILVVGISSVYFSSQKNNSSKNSVLNSDGDLVINASQITGTASFFPVKVDGVDLEVLSIKASDGTVRTAFNTCQVCYDSGRGYYEQEDSYLVCQNCGNMFAADDVEVVRGGCNPVPIEDEGKAVNGDVITIPSDYLKQYKEIFSNWKI